MKITSKKVSRWRNRFLTLGMAGLERDAPRPGRTPKINASLIRRVMNLTTRQKPPNATHWRTRSMARAAGISEASVRRIWRSHGLKPHRLESFKISNDPKTGAVRKREKSNPSLGSYSTWPAAQARSEPNHDPRLQAQRHRNEWLTPDKYVYNLAACVLGVGLY
jgi:hypothetical protein